MPRIPDAEYNARLEAEGGIIRIRVTAETWQRVGLVAERQQLNRRDIAEHLLATAAELEANS